MSNTEISTGYEAPTIPDLADLDAGEGSHVEPGSYLAQLREEAQKAVRRDDVIVRVPQRPNMSLVFDVNFENKQLEHWRKQATIRRRGKENDFDVLKFASIILAATNTDFIFKGQPMGMTLASKELREMFSAMSYFDLIKNLFGSDADIIKASGDVMSAAGYTQDEDDEYVEDEEDDPTQTS